MDYVLTTNNISKQYRQFKALDGLTMRVPKGAIYGFVGRNGAGKTTLIRLICGLQSPTSGDYTLYSIDSRAKDIVQSRKRIGAVVETPSIYMDMTAEENLKLLLFVRRYWYSDDISDLADRFHMNNNNVSVRLSRIRNKLKNYLQKEGYEI